MYRHGRPEIHRKDGVLQTIEREKDVMRIPVNYSGVIVLQYFAGCCSARFSVLNEIFLKITPYSTIVQCVTSFNTTVLATVEARIHCNVLWDQLSS